jgi:hypothetical protein
MCDFDFFDDRNSAGGRGDFILFGGFAMASCVYTVVMCCALPTLVLFHTVLK